LHEGKFDIVVACDLARGIGQDNKLPWHLSKDMKYFRDLTKGDIRDGRENFVIMGSNTWRSIPPKHRPLPQRRNIILSRKPQELEPAQEHSVQVCNSFDSAIEAAFNHPDVAHLGARCFVIGGAKVYEQAVAHKACGRIYLTQINAKFDCNVFFPPFEDKFSLLSETEVQEENGLTFSFKIYGDPAHGWQRK
jgi:dihydrofolate reductase